MLVKGADGPLGKAADQVDLAKFLHEWIGGADDLELPPRLPGRDPPQLD